MRRRKIFIAIVVVLVLLPLAGLLYLRFGDLGWVRGTVERRISDALGRELTIAGTFDLEVLPSVHLVAENVSLAGPPWSDDPVMVHVDRLELAVGLQSLLNRRPVVVHDLQIKGARVRLERDAEGRANWDFEIDRKPAVAVKPDERPLFFERLELADIELSYHGPSREAPLRFGVDRLEAGPDEEGMFALSLDGSFDRFPTGLTGRITSLPALLEGEPLVYELHGRVGDVEAVSSGEIADLATLGGPDLEMRLHGPDLEGVTDLLGLPSLGSGSFELAGRVRPSPEGVELALDADLVDLQAEARGHADTLVDPRRMNLDVKVSGKDLHAAGFLLGRQDLPPGDFEASATVSRDGGPVTLHQLTARVGAHFGSAEGVIRTHPDFVDRELRFDVEGPHLSIFSNMVGTELSERSYRLAGHLVRVPEGISVESFDGRVGEVDLHATGVMDDLFRLDGARLRVRTSGPDLSAIRVLSHLTLPSGAFVLDGTVTTTDEALILDGAAGQAGDTAVSCDGTIALTDGLIGTDLTARISGHDPLWIAPLTGLETLPAEPYDFSGSMRFTGAGPHLDTIEGTYGNVAFELDGDLSDLLVQVSGPDLSWLSHFGAPDGLPTERFELEGRVRTLDVGYAVEGFKATLGSIALELDGRLGDLPDLNGTDVDIEARGSDLSALAAYADLPPLPAEGFSVAGHVAVESGAYRLQAVSAELGRHSIEADGTLVPSADRVGTALTLAISGPDLADAGRIAGELGMGGMSSGLPETTYSLAGAIRVDETGYHLSHVVARVAEAEARLSGRLGRLPDGHGTDLTVEARGPDASVLDGIHAFTLPAVPFRVEGRVEHDRSGTRFHGVVADLGEYHAELDGTLGEPPRLAGTNLDVRVSGPDPALLGHFVDLPPLAADAFEVSAHVDGRPTLFEVSRLAARLGRSDLAGELRVDLTGNKPELVGELTSEYFNLDELLGVDRADADEPETADGLLFSDAPLSLEILDRLNADVHWTVGETMAEWAALGNVELRARVLDGRFVLDPLHAEGYGGAYSGTLTLEPIEDGHRLQATGKAEQARLSLLKYSGDPTDIAPVDVDLRLTGRGRSWHEVASTATGRLMLVQGQGRLDNSALTAIAADPLSKLFTTLNPFTKSEPYTKLECSVILIEMTDGIAEIGPLAIRTDKMVMVGNGRVDLASETIDLDWATKSRQGVGLSAGTLTNSYIKLGGTLSNPQVTISPLKATGEVGATVATAGFWLLYRMFSNRVMAERKVCKHALEKAEKKTRKSDEKRRRAVHE